LGGFRPRSCRQGRAESENDGDGANLHSGIFATMRREVERAPLATRKVGIVFHLSILLIECFSVMERMVGPLFLGEKTNGNQISFAKGEPIYRVAASLRAGCTET
jgi:predicted ABC-type transport system involved in lysophospholipase L1 biosynthesis ATPase subunit